MQSWTSCKTKINLEQDFVIDLLKKLAPELDSEHLKEKEYKAYGK